MATVCYGRADHVQFAQRTVNQVVAVGAARPNGRAVGAQQGGDVFFDGREPGGLPIRRRIQSSCYRNLQVRVRKLYRVEVVEGNPPHREAATGGEEQPVEKPQGARVLHVRIPARFVEQHEAQPGGNRARRAGVGRPPVLGNQFGRQAPEADGAHHVLTHPHPHRGVLPGENPGVPGGKGKGLAEPAVARVESFVPRESRLGRFAQSHFKPFPRSCF